ncbi:eukaryotic translation initiation factor 2B subunit epsilon [Rhodnius prolixus]|uniref:eukaryotic translation initiation factor 2B subunit epsilon n=1 Tax=Rhodnius prolixus TaxID=13249 RepID=UPI003D1882A8
MKKSKNLLDSVQKEDLIQAVLIADSYDEFFSPVTDIPCLMPLVNRPLLDYTLQCLAAARVQEVIIFTALHSQKIKKFISNGHWGRMTVNVVVSDGCRSLGDALRDLDAKALIRSDFILLTGDIVANLKLLPALERHKKVQKMDSGAAMTIIYKECGHKLRSDEDQMYLAIDNNTDRILMHNRCSSIKKNINIEVNLLLEHENIDIRCDLLDTKICICSVTVPPLFSDNFDFQTRDDFVRGLLMDEEILASTVYSYVLPSSEYAASVTSWQNYHYISHDVIHRWTYPLVPDMFVDEHYSYKRKHIYIQEDVTLAQGCSLFEDVVIGGGSIIQENVDISCSVIGKKCKISANSSVTNSHLFSNVIIESGCKIDYCVIAEGCVVKEGVKLTSCILGPGVILDKDKVLENVRLQASKPLGEFEAISEKAYEYIPDDEDDNEEESESDSEIEGVRKRTWRGLKLDPPHATVDDTSESEASASERGSPVQEDTNLFYNEVVDSLLRGYEDKLPCDNLVLELNSSRFAYNVSVNEVNYYVVKAIVTLKDDFSWEALSAKLKYFMPLFVNYVRNEMAMADCLQAIEDCTEMQPQLVLVIMNLIHLLYKKDILSEESILEWYKHPRSDSIEEIRKKVRPFIYWLEEAETSETEEE